VTIRNVFARRAAKAIGAGTAALALAAGSMAGWPQFVAAKAEAARISPNAAIADFYRARGGAPLWFAPGSRNAARQLVQLLSTAQADGLNPKRYDVRAVSRAVADAEGRNPAAVQRAEMLLSAAFVAYSQDLHHDPQVGIIYVDPELKPKPPSAADILGNAAHASSLSDYVQKMGWMNPIYAQLRQAIAARLYRSDNERRVLELNRERARALPGGNGRYVIVNPPAARLYMYDNGQVVDSMRVVAGRPEPVAETPMMNAFIRYVALNPYWNSPSDITAKRLAPKVVKEGRAYLNRQGYQLMSDWSTNAHPVDPMTVDWRDVVAGKVKVWLRQKPGPANSMGKMKFMFPNQQGIWLHDTPEKEKIEDAARLQSNGCVRLEDAARFSRWLFNGHPPSPKGAKPEQKVSLPTPVPLYITYLTAVPSGTSIVYFDDFYGKDRAATKRG
jgi:murein L,D-transpeptidase YcbB/YkuD